jgi:tetratricopeptide (TPR) repeat protein
MPNFVWTAKNKFGNSVVREISADSAEQAKAQLLAEGCTEIELKENEVIAAVRTGFHKPKFFGEELKITAQDRVKQRNKPPLTFVRALGRGVINGGVICICVILLAAYEIYRGNIVSAVILGFGLLFWLGYQMCVQLPGIYYRKLLKALDWHRWEEVLRLVTKLRSINRIHFIKVPETALTRYRAKALAGLGNLPQALQEYAPCENQPGCPSWLYKTLVADIYDTAKQHDKALELVKQSLEEKRTPSVYIGLAARLLRCKRDPVEVKAALAEAEKGTLIDDIEMPIVLTCHGVIANLEKDYSAAQRHFRAALEIMERTRHKPFRDGHISKTKARLCCVLAKQGDSVDAKNISKKQKNTLSQPGKLNCWKSANKHLENLIRRFSQYRACSASSGTFRRWTLLQMCPACATVSLPPSH